MMMYKPRVGKICSSFVMLVTLCIGRKEEHQVGTLCIVHFNHICNILFFKKDHGKMLICLNG